MSNISLIQIVDQKNWEKYLTSRKEADFLQSWHWGVFQQKIGKKVFPLAIYQNQPKKQIGAALLIKEVAKRGDYLTIAGGPLLDWEKIGIEQLKEIFNQLVSLAKQEHCNLIRFRPQALASQPLESLVKKLGAVQSPIHLTADLTLQLDLSLSQEQLLAQMRKNTRYEIRKAEKLGVEVKTTTDPKAIKEFYQYQVQLAQKHHFVPFSYNFLFEQFKEFASHNKALLFSSFYQGKLLASAFVIFYNQQAAYHYGISTPANDHLPGAYACQWAAINEAKKRGCLRYNFWGIAPPNKKNHRFAGVTVFKKGFGGEEVFYLPAQDVPVNWSFWLTHLFELCRKKLRRL